MPHRWYMNHTWHQLATNILKKHFLKNLFSFFDLFFFDLFSKPNKLNLLCCYAASNNTNNNSSTKIYHRQDVTIHCQTTKNWPTLRKFNIENRYENQPSLEIPTFQSIIVDLMKLCVMSQIWWGKMQRVQSFYLLLISASNVSLSVSINISKKKC